MTYDERQEIAEYLDLVKKNCERTLRSIEMAMDKLGSMKCEKTVTKEEFLKNH